MKFYYDFHIHSCLSPCGDDNMTPNNIVNMAIIKGLDVIAVTDHNSCENVEAVIKAGKKAGLLVIAGMELTTSEEIHILCLFKNSNDALSFSDFINNNIQKVKNNTEIFGHQTVMNEYDEVTGEKDYLLSNASNISSYKIVSLLKKYNGIAIPAHIDKMSNSILAILGSIDENDNYSTVEFSKNFNKANFFESYPELIGKYKEIHNSDAHYLWDISEKINFLDLNELSINAIFEYLSFFDKT